MSNYSNFEEALKWSKQNTSSNASSNNEPKKENSFDWAKYIPDIAIAFICLAAIVIGIILTIMNWNKNPNMINTSHMAPNLIPASIAANEIPILY